MAYSTWLFPDDVFGPQKKGPDKGGLNDTQYPDCGFSRIYTLENILYGLEFIITPLLQTISDNQDLTKINDETTSLTLTGSAIALPAAAGSGTLIKVSIYNLTTNANVTIKIGGDFILEAGVSMDLSTSDATNIFANGTAGNTLQLIYTYKL
jgi:hypothetical protein